jgi:hypothetical protein
MNCACISDIEKKLKEKLNKETGIDIHVECRNTGFVVIENTMELVHITNFTATGDTKGYKKGKDIRMTANYCPFCGKPFAKNEETSHG